MNLTAQEKQVLKIAFNSAAGNGHDFGIVEEVVEQMRPMRPQAVGGIISSLVKKGVFTVHGPVITNEGGPENTWTQFTWDMDVSEVKAAQA